jgi:hypothetical protein
VACRLGGVASQVAKEAPVSKTNRAIRERAASLSCLSGRNGHRSFVTVVAHVAYYTSFYCAGKSLRAVTGHSATLADILTIMPLVNTITSLRISLGGVGVREMLFQELLGHLAHVPPAIAAFTASLGYTNQISWALVGGAVFLFSKKILSH